MAREDNGNQKALKGKLFINAKLHITNHITDKTYQ